MKLKFLTMSLLSLLLSAFAKADGAKSEPLKVGDAAPQVTATTDAGTPIDLGAVYKKQPYTLVYFYPKADTPGCTKQGCSLRDGYEKLTERGVAVIGVSKDKVADQKAFKEKYNLPFTLIADEKSETSNAFGVPTYPGGITHRSAYLIKDGKVVYTDYKGTTEEQADVILKFLDENKS